MKDKALYSDYSTLEITIDKDNIEVIYHTGCELAANGHYAEAMRCWLLASDYGSPDSEYRIGLCYFRETGSIKRDMFKALYWLQSAARNGNVYAALQLVSYYEQQYSIRMALFRLTSSLKKEETDSRQLKLGSEFELDALSKMSGNGVNEQDLITISKQLLNSYNMAINNYANENQIHNRDYDWKMVKKSQRILASSQSQEEKVEKLHAILDYFIKLYPDR